MQDQLNGIGPSPYFLLAQGCFGGFSWGKGAFWPTREVHGSVYML